MSAPALYARSRRNGVRALPMRCSRCANAAMQRFLKLGLPTQRDETWRYTDLREPCRAELCGGAAHDARRDRP